jgi:cell fate (sporulation/competence/biofilm development) regulator YmcA (YheA/YmcA/DUF963 family)
MTNIETNNSNAFNNTTAAALNVDTLSSLVAAVKKTRNLVTAFGSDHEELSDKCIKTKAELQTALDTGDYEKMSKLTAEIKRTEARLAENPTEKVQNFDTAINNLNDFIKVATEIETPVATPTSKLKEVA